MRPESCFAVCLQAPNGNGPVTTSPYSTHLCDVPPAPADTNTACCDKTLQRTAQNAVCLNTTLNRILLQVIVAQGQVNASL